MNAQTLPIIRSATKTKTLNLIAKTLSAIPSGFTGQPVEVEGSISQGLPSFNIVGMANKTINEARERVRSAIISSSFSFPDRKLTINLAPADLEKDGSYLDLPIAITVLVLSHQLRPEDINSSLFVGELSLDGHLRPVKGIINILEVAQRLSTRIVFLPTANLLQAHLFLDAKTTENDKSNKSTTAKFAKNPKTTSSPKPPLKIYGVDTLQQLFLHLKHQQLLPSPSDSSSQNPTFTRNSSTPNTSSTDPSATNSSGPFLDHIRGQALAKRALEIAIAGHHNILISGPPGAGKTLLARTAANLLPPLSPAEQIELTKIYSLANLATDNIIAKRPFRSPHHTASAISIIGGGAQATPGEISLAHKGILFLDELPEFPRSLLETLRQPLEDKTITISRAHQKTTYPADFMLIATMNPCPCGYLGDPTHPCKCRPADIDRYQKKLSGPLFDRIDMNLTVEKVKNSDLFQNPPKNHPEHDVVKNNIKEVIARQSARYGRPGLYNSSLSSVQVSQLLKLDSAAETLLKSAAEKLDLSARAYFKTIKVARTIADLADSPIIQSEHLAEALTFRHR